MHPERVEVLARWPLSRPSRPWNRAR